MLIRNMFGKEMYQFFKSSTFEGMDFDILIWVKGILGQQEGPFS